MAGGAIQTERCGFGRDWAGDEPPAWIRDEIARRAAETRLQRFAEETERRRRLIDFTRAKLAEGLTLSQIRKRARAEVAGWSTVEMRDVRDVARELSRPMETGI